jgi:hypothetical protein
MQLKGGNEYCASPRTVVCAEIVTAALCDGVTYYASANVMLVSVDAIRSARVLTQLVYV